MYTVSWRKIMGQKTLWDSLKRLAKDGWITIKPNGRRNKASLCCLARMAKFLAAWAASLTASR